MGTKLIPKQRNAGYSYEFYRLKRPGKYIYTYDYQPEEQWLTRNSAYDSKDNLMGEFVFREENLPVEKEGYILFRNAEEAVVEIVGACGLSGENGWKEDERRSLEYRVSAYVTRPDVADEISRTVARIQELRTDNKLVFTLLSDTHYVINGNWEYTLATIQAVSRELTDRTGKKVDGVIHLGDFSDGILSKEICRNYSHRVLDSLYEQGVPVYVAIGNHDTNYFRNNTELLDSEEQQETYFNCRRDFVLKREPDDTLWYRVDLKDSPLTLIVLHSFDKNEELRYGFSEEEVIWVQKELAKLDSEERRILVLSHDAPLKRLDYWAKDIRNGEVLCDILDEWNTAHGYRVIGFLHGHSHADFIYRERSFPIVSVGCSKIEYFEDKKPAGAVCPVRLEGEVTQELWDTLILDPLTGEMDFVRFGAGNDRHVTGNAENGMRRELNMSREKQPLVWAHRGASGYAPENTLEAFALAVKLGADGVELDVQFTKDRQLVVIHDERIDRTSDGHGLVVDYTLEELRRFNYNRTHQEYPWTDIPTLREVLELLKPTNLTINIELKTGINFYPGIEEAVLNLVRECDMEERVLYSSFNHESILRIKEKNPSARCGFLYVDGIAEVVSYAKKYGVEALHPSLNNTKYPCLIEECKAQGIRLHVWTVNEETDMEKMRQLGVDAIITNFPDRARKLYC